MNKKFIASILAGACAMSMTSIASFAASSITLPSDVTAVESDWGTDGYFEQKVTVSSSIQTPTLKVTVPTTAAVLVNPYKIAVSVGGADIDDTIISPEYEVKNESNCGVTVTVTASAAVKDATNKDVSVATKPLSGTETKKTAFLYVETTKTSGDYFGKYVEKAEKPPKNGTLTDEQIASNEAMTRQMVLTTKATSKDLIKLDAGETTAQSAFFKIQGEAASKTATPWAAKDALDVALTLKIAPAANGVADDDDSSVSTPNDAPLTAVSFANGALGSVTFAAPADLTLASSKTMTATATQTSGIIQVTPTFTVGAGHTVTATYKVGAGAATAMTSGTQVTISGVTSGDTVTFEFTTDDGAGNGTTYTITATVA